MSLYTSFKVLFKLKIDDINVDESMTKLSLFGVSLAAYQVAYRQQEDIAPLNVKV